MLEANLADRQVVQYVIKRFGIHAKHKLGQNFLIRPDVVATIAEAAELGKGVPVMEIGAGIGTLTQGLAETGADVTAFELDHSLERVLSHTLEHYKNVHIIYEDVLKADLKSASNPGVVKIAEDTIRRLKKVIKAYGPELQDQLDRVH